MVKLFALSGAGPRADCYSIHFSSLATDINTEVLGWVAIKKTASAEEVENLVVPDNATKMKFKRCLMVPPLVLNTILSIDFSDTKMMIPTVSKAMQLYDRTSEQIKACEHLRPVVYFLWAVSKGSIPPTVMDIDRSPEGVQWSKGPHDSKITKITIPPREAFSPIIKVCLNLFCW